MDNLTVSLRKDFKNGESRVFHGLIPGLEWKD
jgi:hypothetical protein